MVSMGSIIPIRGALDYLTYRYSERLANSDT